MPTLPAELVATERLAPLSGKASGEQVSIDKGVLAEIVERTAQAIGAVERGNERAAGVKTLWSCVETIMRTGVTPASCPSP